MTPIWSGAEEITRIWRIGHRYNAILRPLYFNKRPIDHIAHLRNQFKSINIFKQSYDYIIMLISRKNQLSPFLRIEWSFIVKLWVPFSLGCFVPILVEIDHWLCRGKCLKLVNVFSLFCYNLPLEKSVALHLNKLEVPSPKDAFSKIG